MFRDGVQSFDPIIDRSRDLSHSVARSFGPNPRIRMQNPSKRQSHLSWDPSANLADTLTFANDWLSSLLITTIVKRFPAFTKILPESRLAFVQRLLLELPRMHAQGAPILLFSSLNSFGCHENGWFSQLGLELHRRKDALLLRQRRI
jgi:hypothetical protein